MENAKAIKKLSPKERVREFLDEIEIRFIDAERKCGFSRGYLGTGGEMTTDKLRMLKKNYPTIDIQYIVTGKLRDPKKERITKDALEENTQLKEKLMYYERLFNSSKVLIESLGNLFKQ
jgi:hypothetical protein